MTDGETRLETIRREIDALDAELLDILRRRGRAVREVGALKAREAEPRYYRPEREFALLRRIAAANPGPFSAVEITRLFREIVSSCRALEQRITVGCATAEAACAVTGHFGGAVDIRILPDAAQALRAVADARCDHAMIGFSRGGVASPAMAMLRELRLVPCGEWYAAAGERFVAIGRERVPPTGDDWTSFILSTEDLAAVESWCRSANIDMRSAPTPARDPNEVAGSPVIVDVAMHMSDARLAPLVTRYSAGILGAYPAAVRARDGLPA